MVLAIGNGHLSRTRDLGIARHLIGHYLTLYGYDEEQRVFYVYDSMLRSPPERALPVGNDARSFEVLLRDWRGPVYYPCIGMAHVYLVVGGPTTHPNDSP